ncbi:MAG: hypothetical protein Q7T20_09785 [Saprospiraceae bacterium]|nr:hypothetical protein [Saprospiraceae bacterium]
MMEECGFGLVLNQKLDRGPFKRNPNVLLLACSSGRRFFLEILTGRKVGKKMLLERLLDAKTSKYGLKIWTVEKSIEK